MSFREGRVDLEESAVFSFFERLLHRVPVTLPFLPVLNKTLLYISLHWGICQIVVGSASQVERGWKPVIIILGGIHAEKWLRGVPDHIRSDNGPEFTARAVREWLPSGGVR